MMGASTIMWKLLTVLLLLSRSWGQKDPLNDFCRRFSHQSTVIDRKLYIDGGYVDWNPISQNNNNYTNTWLLYNDLNTSPTGPGVPQLYANLSKNASIPDVSGGTLWPDEVNKRFYLYGGEYMGISPNSPNLWSYDVLYNQWESFGTPDDGIQSVSYGMGVGISELGQGYVLGGWLSNATVPGWSGGPLATSTLIKYDMDKGHWTNNTGPDPVPRAEGVMVYLPASNSGLLVYFGGITAPYNNETVEPVPMSTIYIYDIQSSKWYTQTATGNVPANRRRFCAGAAWAPDKSSYNIYLYGGLGFGANATGFDDVYILSLPSFQWVQWWEGDPGGKPHHSLTCNVVESGQMLIIGGTFPLTNDCDSPSSWGTHNLDLGKQSGRMWNPYQLNTTSYVVPDEIISIVGGSPTGGATATAPSVGFDNRDLSVYFAQQATIASRTATRAIPSAPSATSTSGSPTPSKSSKLSAGAIGGIAAGGAVLLIALIFGACCCIRRYRRNNRPQPTPVPVQYIVPSYPQGPPTPQSPYYSPQYYTPQHYQLPAAVPVELENTSYQNQHDPKFGMLQDAHPVYEWQNTPQPPRSEATSPHPSLFSSGDSVRSNTAHGGQLSPTPTYSSVGRSPRRPVPTHQMTYSS